MKRWVWGGLAVSAAVVSPTLTMCVLDWLDDTLLPPVSCNLAGPVLAASTGDSEATLNWQLADDQEPKIGGWQYLQSAQGKSSLVTPDIGPATARYVVSGLLNDIAYTFQMRAKIGDAAFGCWSAAVSVVPRRIDDVVERIEKNQQAIAESMAKVVESMARGQELLERLGEQGISRLGVVATSTNAIARHSDDIRKGVEQLAANVDGGGGKIAGCLANIAAQLGERPGTRDGKDGGRGTGASDGEGGECNSSLKGVYPTVASPPAHCHTLLHVLRFGERSHVLGEQNKEALDAIVNDLLKQEDGLVLTEGHATSVGGAVYNLRLSDKRAACTSLCLRARIPAKRKFAFREIARGEALNVSELAGRTIGHRVKVIFCEGGSVVPDAREPPKRPKIEECGCP